jgi:hypothetical protein
MFAYDSAFGSVGDSDYDYVCCFTENTKGYYPEYDCKEFETLKFPKEFTFKDTAHNTCFFYVNNSDVTKKYTDMCLSSMKKINDIDGVSSGHSVFLEQTILYELSLVNGWKTKTLMDTKFDDLEWEITLEIKDVINDLCDSFGKRYGLIFSETSSMWV